MALRTFPRALWAILLGLAVAGMVMLTADGTRADPGNPQSDEQEALRLINYERGRRGLAPLEIAVPAREVARNWAVTMASEGALRHNPDFAQQIAERIPDWSQSGENVGVGANVPQLHEAFMNSPAHRDNVLGNFEAVGIGVRWEGSRLWVTFNFASSSTGWLAEDSRAVQWTARAWGYGR